MSENLKAVWVTEWRWVDVLPAPCFSRSGAGFVVATSGTSSMRSTWNRRERRGNSLGIKFSSSAGLTVIIMSSTGCQHMLFTILIICSRLCETSLRNFMVNVFKSYLANTNIYIFVKCEGRQKILWLIVHFYFCAMPTSGPYPMFTISWNHFTKIYIIIW